MEPPSFLEQCLSTISVTGVLHVGAHEGQEAAIYAKRGIERVTWIEANPDIKDRLTARVAPLGHRVIIQAVGDAYDTNCPFHVTSNNGESSSLLPLAKHREVWPDITESDTQRLTVRTLDWLHSQHDFSKHNFWVLDIQGMEACALRGAQTVLPIADWIVCEFTGELYSQGSTLPEIDELLPDFSAVSGWTNPSGDFGEVFYKRIRRSGRDLLRFA